MECGYGIIGDSLREGIATSLHELGFGLLEWCEVFL